MILGEVQMVYCNECGKKNEDEAQYCTQCGNYLAKRSTFEKDIEKAAEEFGKKAEQFGKQIEKKAQAFAKSVAQSRALQVKQCSDCETELDYDALYCWKCGKKI
jgi:ribosomal protein L40E